MPGASPQTIDSVIQNQENADGFRGCIPLMLNAAGVGTGPLTASTAPEIIAWATDFNAIKWDHGDAATALVKWKFRMPFDYDPLARDQNGNQDDIFIKVHARKLDTDDTENATLALWCSPQWITAGTDTALNALTTPAAATLAAANASTAPAGMAEYTLNIGTRLRAEDKRIDAGDYIIIAIGPSATVGATDLDLEMLEPTLFYRKHSAFTDKTLR